MIMCEKMEKLAKEYAAEAIKEVTKEVSAKKDIEFAKKMLANNEDITKIVQYTNLSVDEIEKIKASMEND